MVQDVQMERAIAKADRSPGKPVFVRNERRQGWSDELPIYVLRCHKCRMLTETYPAGYGRIICCNQFCRYSTRVQTWQRIRDKEIKPVAAAAIGGAIFLGSAAIVAAVLFSLVFMG